jgi:hypothetical protein
MIKFRYFDCTQQKWSHICGGGNGGDLFVTGHNKKQVATSKSHC